MNKTVTVTVEKSTKKKPEKLGSATSAMASQLITAASKPPALTAAQEAKAKRDAGRATRYPQAAAAEAAKKAGAKTETATKEKKVQKSLVSFIPRAAKKEQVLHVLDERSRPSSGARLFAHTHAVLTILGLLDASRPAVPQAYLLQMLGQRAVSHHRAKLNIEDAPNHGARLSIAGRNHFAARMTEGKIDTAAANAFVAMFLDGSVDQNAIGVIKSNTYQVKF